MAQGQKVLLLTHGKRPVDMRAAYRLGAEMRGISQARLWLEVQRRHRGRQKLPPHDYFLYGLHQPWQTEADRDAFLGEPAFNRVSGALAARRGGRILGIFNDKRLTAMILERAGLPMPEIRAIYTRARGATVWPGLHSAEEIVAFLRAPGAMPLFGKPVYGAHSHGAISLVGVEGEEVRLGDGRLIALTALAEEIVTGYPEGYLFQNLVTPHPDMLALTGPALATMRVVTLYDGPEPSVLYAVQKIPGKDAMVDDITSGVDGKASLDIETGRIGRVQYGPDLGGIDMEKSQATGQVLPGAIVPFVKESLAMALEAHALFPDQGILGVDLAATAQGPIVVELNAFPGHGLYQKAFVRGIYNPDFAPRFRAALARKGVRKGNRHLPFP